MKTKSPVLITQNRAFALFKSDAVTDSGLNCRIREEVN